MPKIVFTDNLKTHIDCPPAQVTGDTVFEALNQVFEIHPALKNYILDDQDRLRRHMLIAVDNEFIRDRIYLSDAVKADSEIYVIQALSGG